MHAESGVFAFSPMKSDLTVLFNDLAKSDSVDLDQRLAPYKLNFFPIGEIREYHYFQFT
jgi:hypothetical protein